MEYNVSFFLNETLKLIRTELSRDEIKESNYSTAGVTKSIKCNTRNSHCCPAPYEGNRTNVKADK
jgi:hypothetical protein